MAEAFIKFYKKFLDWEWYKDTNTKVLFIHCMLKANWKETRWRGIVLKPGQFVTSLPRLAEETDLTIKQVRTALSHLKKSGEVADKSFTKFRIITVKNWDEYQSAGRQGADRGQTRGRQRAADKEYKNNKNNKIHDFSERAIDYEALENEI